ncbi:hypothetical protein [Sphaerisporangium corydalis]|uniref:Uncharacterized protein n=1 Tax=Sphaerisporangium corydalis TaxID=1441875 RepID=A0ABV9EGC1_9ACTN|nr:hypothetical protein [Sphaerisporangium corydalis]
MSGRVRLTAASAVVASLALTGVVLLATSPLTAPRANAAQVAMADPTEVEPSDPTITDVPSDVTDPDGQDPQPEPTVTVTITESPDPTVTKTKTVDPKPKPTKTKPVKSSPSATKTAPVVPPVETLPTSTPPTLPTSEPILPSTQPTVESQVPDPQVSLAPASPTLSPSESAEPAVSFEEPTPDSVPIEIRNASPEYDQLELSRKLAIPGVLLAVLVMLGVLIFEGRIRRMAHAAAVRKAGPRSPGRHRGDEFPGYPMPGYPIYHGGTTYAPIISFVPVQGHPGALGGPQDGPSFGGPYELGPGPSYGQGAGGGQIPLAPIEGGPISFAPGASERWPRENTGGFGSGETITFPAAGRRPAPEQGPVLDGTPSQGPGSRGSSGDVSGFTLQAPLPGDAAEPRRGILGRFRRRSS